MVGANQWTIIYTRHKSQKRKSYHDGMLVVESCKSNQKKVLLYDDCGKLLDYRFLRNCDKIEIGETLVFDSAIVEICDVVQNKPGFLDTTNGGREIQITRHAVLQKEGFKCPTFTKGKVVEVPKEMGLQVNNELDMGDANSREWHVIYTKQKKQKKKKYFDGILKLLVSGIRQRQVILSSEDGKILEKRYVNCQDDIKSNCTLELEQYLVEVGEAKVSQTDSEPCITNSKEFISNFESSKSMMSNFKDLNSQDAKNRENNTFGQEDLEKSNIGLVFNKVHTEPTRTVNQILTVLKKPVISKGSICDTRVVDLVQKNSTLPMVEECIVPNFLVKSSKEGAHSEFPFKENVSNCAVNTVCISTNIGQQIHAKKSLCQGSSLGSAKSLLIPNARSLKRSIRHFQAPTVEFNSSVQHLVFPENNATQKFRQVFVPEKFTSLASYRNIMSSAVYEEINLTLFDIGHEFHKARHQILHLNKQRPSCMHGNGRLQIVKKDGPNKGRLFYGCPSQVESCLFSWANISKLETNVSEIFDDWSDDEMEHAFHCFHIDLYMNCEIFSRKIGNFVSKKRRHDEYEYGEESAGLNKTSTYLKLGSSRNDKRSSHSKGDLWIISSNIKFSKEGRDDFVAFAVSNYHGPSSDGILEVIFLGDKPRNLPLKKTFALHGPCIQSELAMLNILRDMHIPSIPLLPLLLQHSEIRTENLSNIEVEKLSDQFIIKYNLNEDQAKVVHIVARWFVDSSNPNSGLLSSQPEICLVHGIFGSGKSYLLTVIVIFLTSISKRCNKQMRILISAATNVAIDRILIGLLELGFDDFIRVGSIKRIARKILPYSVYATSEVNRAEDATLKELQEQLREAPIYERLEIEEEIKSLKDGKMAKRREKMKDSQVVGVTCCSTINPILKGNKFQICLLDECAQIPEPLSLLPISQFGCLKLLAVGDPAQLPPTLLGGAGFCESKDAEMRGDHRKHDENCCFEDDESGTKGSTSVHDLRRSLFVRLAEMGYEPVMLRTQYRCHPRLIAVPNELFYGGRIICGCREIDRLPLFPGLPPLLFWDTRAHGNEVKDSSKSYNNPFEARMLCELIIMMLKHGIPGCQIGVIVLYTSQACLVQELLLQGCNVKGVKTNRSISSKALENQQWGNSKNCGDGNFLKNRHSIGDVQISTVDAFQGMEKNIIILSCCRTNGLGFLSSPNRLNVALTRARHHLIVIGKASNLRSSRFWKKLLSNAASIPGAYISTPESGPEIVISSMRENLLRENVARIENISLLTTNEEQASASKSHDENVLHAQQTQNDQEEESTTQRLGPSGLLHGVVEEGYNFHLCLRDIDMTELLDNATASVVNNCNDDLQKIYVGGSESEHGDSMEYDHANKDSCDFKRESQKSVFEAFRKKYLAEGYKSTSGIGNTSYEMEHGPDDEAKDKDKEGDECNHAPTFALGFFADN